MKIGRLSRNILFALTVWMSSVGVVQAADCKYAENSVDKFTKATVVITEWEQLTHWMREVRREMTGYVSASSYDGEQYLRIKIEYVLDLATAKTQEAGEYAISVPEGGELMIAMSDGAVLKLPASKSAVGHTIDDDPHPGWVTTIAAIDYELDASTSEVLMAQGAKAIRVVTNNRHFDVKIHKRNIDDIKKAVGCVQ